MELFELRKEIYTFLAMPMTFMLEKPSACLGFGDTGNPEMPFASYFCYKKKWEKCTRNRSHPTRIRTSLCNPLFVRILI